MPGYNNMAPKMESNKQETKNLMDDNPVARDAAGDRPWITKHYRSTVGSPAKHITKFLDKDHPHNKNHDARPMHSHK